MSLRKKIILFDQDNSTVETMAPMADRHGRLMRSLLFSPRVLAKLPPETQSLAKRDPERYFIDQIIRLKSDFYAAAAHAGVEIWDKQAVLPRTQFMRDHWTCAASASRHFLSRHFPPLQAQPFPGIGETIRRLKESGARLVMLTDAVPEHAIPIARNSGFVETYFDLVISRESFHAAAPGGELTIAPHAQSELARVPHYTVRNVRTYPKNHPEIHALIAALLDVEKTDMVLIDDHIGICNIARDSGVDPLLAYYGTVDDGFRRNLKWLREWTEYYATQDDFHTAMMHTPESAANGHIVLRAVGDIEKHIQPVEGPALAHIDSRASVRMADNRPELF